ncbi:MAG: TatD family hydrolase [Isosphaeraceae bacterium]
MNDLAADTTMWVDTHAHLASERLHTQLPAILDRARRAGVAQVIAIATTAADSSELVEIARARPGVFAAVGIHPNDAADATEADWSSISELITQPCVVAVGETGLDRYWDRTPFEDQQSWFERHLALAYQHDLPVVIHCRDCQRDIIELLQRLERPIRGVMHAFTGSCEDAEAFVALGLSISFAGMLTFTNKGLDSLRAAAARVPLDRLLVETDSPYLSPHPFRGKTNEPARVVLTGHQLAEIHGLSDNELAAVTTANARNLFRLSDDQCLPLSN